MAIPMGLNTRRRTAGATATGLPRYPRNDKLGTHEEAGVDKGVFDYPGAWIPDFAGKTVVRAVETDVPGDASTGSG